MTQIRQSKIWESSILLPNFPLYFRFLVGKPGKIPNNYTSEWNIETTKKQLRQRINDFIKVEIHRYSYHLTSLYLCMQIDVGSVILEATDQINFMKTVIDRDTLTIHKYNSRHFVFAWNYKCASSQNDVGAFWNSPKAYRQMFKN